MQSSDVEAGSLIRTIAQRPQWLALRSEAPIEPALPILDAHHHLWDRPGAPYGAADFIADIADNNVRASIYAECTSDYLPDGPDWLKPIGETRSVVAATQDNPSGYRIAAGIIAFADLSRGSEVARVLEGHREAAGERFVGIRQTSIWHPDARMVMPPHAPKPRVPKGLLQDPGFRTGFAELMRAGLVFDAWLYHTQMDELVELATRFPDAAIVINHLGGPIRTGDPSSVREVFTDWRASLGRLAPLPNVRMKIGGFGMRLAGGHWDESDMPPSSKMLAESWRPWFEACVDALGPSRCMLESNFPVDKGSFSYTALWNAFKRLTTNLSPDEREALFHGTAASTYSIPFDNQENDLG